LTSGFDIQTSGRVGSIAAAEAISHVGPRPRRPLKELVNSLVG
jgi:sugar/nucleoside kinase (ribokinase family)